MQVRHIVQLTLPLLGFAGQTLAAPRAVDAFLALHGSAAPEMLAYLSFTGVKMALDAAKGVYTNVASVAMDINEDSANELIPVPPPFSARLAFPFLCFVIISAFRALQRKSILCR